MLITRNFFIGDFFIPAMKPSITDVSTNSSLELFINKYSRDGLLKCLGSSLLINLNENLEDNLVKSTAEQKWKNLVEGEIVTLQDGSKRCWKGLIYKSNPTDENKNMSLLTGYVYFFHERYDYITKSTTGDVTLAASKALEANPGFKVSIAWNHFVDEVVGVNNLGEVKTSEFGSYIDFYSSQSDFSLYEYIRYKNSLDKDTYPNFKPSDFRKIDSLGLI